MHAEAVAKLAGSADAGVECRLTLHVRLALVER